MAASTVTTRTLSQLADEERDGETEGTDESRRYAEGPCTRMNFFTAVNAGLRTALETDDSAVSQRLWFSPSC